MVLWRQILTRGRGIDTHTHYQSLPQNVTEILTLVGNGEVKDLNSKPSPKGTLDRMILNR